MKDQNKTKAQLLNELAELRQRVTELETAEAERKRAEEAVQASETRYRRLFETAQDGILILDADTGQIADANPFLMEMLGHAQEEFLGKELWELGPFKDIAASRAAFLELQSEGYVRYEDLPLETSDGRRIDVEFVSNVYLVDHKRVIQCNIRDITERKRVEAEREQLLAELERRNIQLQTAAGVSKSASTILDPEMLMRQAVDLIRERFDMYYVGIFLVDEAGEYAVLCAGTGEAGQQMIQAEHKLAVGGKSMIGQSITCAQARIAWDVGVEAIHFDNPSLPETRSELALPLISRGQCIGALTVQSTREAAFSEQDIAVLQTMADHLAIAIENARLYEAAQREIAERKQAEEALRQRTVELQTRNEDLDAFAHTVAHDLQNPVGLIMGHAEMLAQDCAAMSDDQQQSVQAIVRSERKMKSIIEELLLLAEVRQVQVGATPLDMASIVFEAQQRLADAVEQVHAEMALPDVSTWPVALGYGPWVEEVWVNYLSNALKYGGRPPRLELGAEAQSDGMVRFWVRDHGPGIPPEDQARLFTPFTRLDQVQVKGHGLGLPIVRRIVEKLGGQVGVESQVGQGSVFSFTLPDAARSQSG